MPTKKEFFLKRCMVLFKGTFTSFFKDKKSKRSHKTVEIRIRNTGANPDRHSWKSTFEAYAGAGVHFAFIFQ
jgi:hypothetical protein